MDDLSRLIVLAKLSRVLAAQASRTSERDALLAISDWYISKAEKIADAPPKVNPRGRRRVILEKKIGAHEVAVGLSAASRPAACATVAPARTMAAIVSDCVGDNLPPSASTAAPIR